jgi:hypothetical protein
MKRGRIAAVVTVAALATTGTALAASGGGPVKDIFGGDEPQQQFAQDLAGQLGVSESKVQNALENVEEQQRSEQTLAFAQSLAAQLDGTSVDDIVKVLDDQQQKLEQQMKSGNPPSQAERPGGGEDPLVSALADGLGKSKSEIQDALDAAQKAEFESHKKEMLQQLDQAVSDGKLTQDQADNIRKQIENGPPSGGPGPGGPGGPPPIGLAVPGPGGPGGGPGGPGGPGGFAGL